MILLLHWQRLLSQWAALSLSKHSLVAECIKIGYWIYLIFFLFKRLFCTVFTWYILVLRTLQSSSQSLFSCSSSSTMCTCTPVSFQQTRRQRLVERWTGCSPIITQNQSPGSVAKSYHLTTIIACRFDDHNLLDELDCPVYTGDYTIQRHSSGPIQWSPYFQ